MNSEYIKKAFRKLPNQGTGNYHLEDCDHAEKVFLKATDPFEYVNICPKCLAICLKNIEEVES